MSKKNNKEQKIIVLVGLVLIIASFVLLLLPNGSSNEVVKKPDFSGVTKICELATLECFYHNVTEFKEDADGLFKYGLFKHGYKKFWIEYDGIIKMGIDGNDVVITPPDSNGVVRIYVPQAKVLGDADVDLKSMSKPVVDKGVTSTLTTEEQSMAFSKAQIDMKALAENDVNLLNKAHNNAKEIIKQFVINIGKGMGQNYTVEWIDDAKLNGIETEANK